MSDHSIVLKMAERAINGQTVAESFKSDFRMQKI